MKNLFPGHFKRDEESTQLLWENCLFVFDANILLNLYRYSDNARSEFLNLLDSIKDRIWLPHRAAEEYLNNRLKVISEQERSYDNTVISINSLKKDLENSRQHPFIQDETMHEVNQAFDKLLKELQDNKKVHTTRIHDDEIQESIAELFEMSIGSPFSHEQLEAILVEGKERYQQKLPPGFKDTKKDTNKEKDSSTFKNQCRQFGDLIVWKQIIEHAKSSEQDILLITDDRKDDWWHIHNGKTLGPRFELVEEFERETEQDFHMYKPDSFALLSSQYLSTNFSDTSVNEIRESNISLSKNNSNSESSTKSIHPMTKATMLGFDKRFIEDKLQEINISKKEILKRKEDLNYQLANIKKHKEYGYQDEAEMTDVLTRQIATYNRKIGNINYSISLEKEKLHKVLEDIRALSEDDRILFELWFGSYTPYSQ